ncbi:MAG: hypothetical protein NUW37_18675 [Planctomycetes bacterium]|nr:hypothetical protein [Planctomycetota bacterium]
MAKAIDIGTCFIVGAEYKGEKESFVSERDAFFSMPNEDLQLEMLTKSGAFYVQKGDMIYVVGDDALKYSMLTGDVSNYRRPMAAGVLNPNEEEAIDMIRVMIEGVIGKASYKGEVCAATIPANPVDASFNTTFHERVLTQFLEELGYEVRAINEALCIIYAENPTVEVDGAVLPFTGIGISFGGGMVNLVAAWRGKQLLAFSAGRSGDWIDAQVATVVNKPVSKCISVKEKKLDLNNIDPRDKDFKTLQALDIYYNDLIEYVLKHFQKEFKKTEAAIDEPIEIVVGGGTASIPGFVDKFKRVLSKTDLPFDVKNVRLAKDPFKCVAQGALIAAISQEKKKKKG